MTNPFLLSEIEDAQPQQQDANPFALPAIQADQRQDLRVTLTGAVRENPDSAAEAARLAKRYPAPNEVLLRNLKDVQLQEAVDKADEKLGGAPNLADYMRTSPFAAKQMHDDIDSLSGIEHVFNVARSVPAGAVKGAGSIASGAGEILNITGRATGLTALSRLVRDTTGLDPAVLFDVGGSLDIVGGGLKSAGAAVGVDAADKNFATDVGEGLGQLAQQIALQVVTGGGASLLTLFSQGVDVMDEKTAKDDAPEALKDTAKLLGGSITALTEKYGIDALLNRVPPAIRNTTLRWIADKLVAGGIEASQEIAEGVLQDLTRVLITNPDAPIGDGALYEGSVAGTAAAIVRAALGVRGRVQVRQDNVDNATQSAEQLQQALQLAAASKLRERNPETFRELIQQMADKTEGAPTSVFIDGQVLQQAVQGMDPEALQQAFPGLAEQLDAAVASNGVVELPISEVLAAAPGTPLEQVFLQNARADANALSLAEAEQQAEQAEQYLKTEAENVLAQAQDQVAWQTSAETVKTTILEQLNTAGRFSPDVNEAYASMVRDFFAVTASRQGLTPDQLYAKYPLRVAGVMPGAGEQVLRAGKVGELEVEGYHFSKADRPVISTSMFGTGLQGSAREQYQNAADKRLRKRAYFYVDKGTGINPEAGVGGRGQRANLSNIYDSNADPLRLKTGRDQLGFESAVLDAGFSGYLDRLEGTQSGQVILLGDQNIQAEVLGDTAKTRGRVVPAPAARESKGRDVIVDALNADKALPSGSPTVALWQQLLAKNPTVLQALTDAGVFAGNQNENLYKSDLVKRFIAATPAESYAQSLSSRLPSAVKATEDPLANVLNITYDVVLADTKTLAKNVAALQALPNVRKLTGKGAKDPVRNVEAFIDHVTNNLLWLHDHMPAPMRDRARLWYDGGRKTVEAWAQRYGISEMQGAAAIAVLSPQNGWFANVSQAERIADMVFGLRNFAWDDAMTAEAERISAETGLDEKMQAAVGKTLGELLATPDIAARWARVYDQTYNNRAYRVLTPEGGAADYVKTGAGNDATMMWKSYSTIAKAISVFTDGRAENVHYQIGKEHKVRNFYNNLFDPNSPLGFATMDTHAVAAALLRPLASADIEVAQAFGGGGAAVSSVTGLNGTYPIYLEAYRRAAEARGLQPRQMQSITWEAVRGLFEAAQKRGMKSAANAIWNRYKAGEIDQAQAQQEIMALAGGITPPAWTEVPFDDAVARTYEGAPQVAIDARKPPTETESQVMFEVAPDPNDGALRDEWQALPYAERLRISQDVAPVIVSRVLKELGTDGDFRMQLGGYEGLTNPSMALHLARPELALTAAKMLGFALSQDSMMVVAETPFVGSEPVGAVTLTLPDGYGATEVKALYDRLWGLEQDGNKLVGGHSTANGQMVILNYSGLTDEDLAGRIDAYLGGEFETHVDQVYSAFPYNKDYGYGSDQQEGAAAARQSPAQRRPSDLRAEASQLLREALASYRAAQPGSDYAQGAVNGRPEQAGNRGGRYSSGSLAPLEGAPTVAGATGPDARLVAVAEQYAADNGIQLRRQAAFVEVDETRAKRIAAAYEAMPHAPQDPAVKEAYENLIAQTMAQYRALEAAGYQFYLVDETNDPYAGNPWNAMRDLRANQRMGVFATEAGFGSGATELNVDDNPLLADTGLTWPYGSPDGEPKRVLANDLFRAVHDAFGHGLEGAGFRARGEENAWQAHVRLFTGSAVGAITSETRGQNSWLNYGPNGESNQTAKVEDTVFADQKTGLMPEWTWTEGVVGDMAAQDGVYSQEGPPLAPNGKPSNLSPELYALVRTPEFKAWFGDWEAFAGMQGGVWNDANGVVSKAVDENGEPMVVYHGTDAGGFTEFNTPGGQARGDLGIFLTPNRAMADSYVKRGRAKDIARDQTGEDAERVSGVYPVFVNIRNPNEANFEGANWDGSRPEQFEVYDENGDIAYTEDGRAFMSLDEARALADEIGGSFEDASPSGESTDSVVRDARRSNNDGAIIREVMDNGGGNSTYAGEPSDVFVAFDPTQIKSVENFGTFDAQDPNIYKQGPRGTFSPSQLLITLGENANLSTFLHESGHFFLEVMADLASQPGAPVQTTEDMAKLLKWFGVKGGTTEWNGYTLDQKRPHHEKFAESMEQYFLEGKAPSVELQPVFRRFRSWMLNAYKSLTEFMRGRDLKVSDEIRQVFDRMLATDEQIAAAEQRAGLMPDFDATAEAAEKLQARSMRDLKWTVNARNKALKKLQKEAAALRKAVEAEVTAEVEAQPVYAARKALRSGTKLGIDGLEALYMGEGDRYALLDWKPLVDQKLAGKTGMHPDIAADMFGFANGDALVRELLTAEPIASVVEGMTDQRMLERHGDLIDQRAIEEAANEAVHNEARAKSLATELKAQGEMLNPRADTGRTNTQGRPITVNAIVAAAKEFAANLTARRRVKDLKNAAHQHRAAEARAAKRWTEATTAGKTAEAVQAKRDQVLNHATAKAMQEAQAEAKKILEFFARVTKGNDEKTVTRGRDPDVVNAARAILAAYDIAPRLEKGALDYLAILEKNDPSMYAALQPSVAGAMNNAKPVGELTMEELRGLKDEIDAMWHLAKRSRQMEVDGNMLDIEDAADQLKDRMQEIGVPDSAPGEARAVTPAEKRARWLQHAGSLLRRAEQWAEGMDGQFGGPFLRLVFQPVKEAANRYRADRVKYRKAYQALVDKVAPALRKGPIAAPEIGYTFGEGHNGIGHAELLHAILHTGNESNKRKLLLGRKWATENADGTLDTSRWDALITRLQNEGALGKAHYDFAQGVWDLLGQTKPLAQKTHRDVFGRYFAEVTADEFTTPFGTYRGGYVPAQADPLIVQDADLRKLAEAENENMAYSFPATNKGFTKGRVEYNRPLLLNLRTIGQHIDKVLLFSHMEPAVRDVNKLLSQKGVSYSLGRIDPSIYAGMLTPWLSRSARQIVETPIMGDGGISRVLSAARSRAGMALMFANVSNSLQQLTGFSTAFAKLKADGLNSHMLRATAQFIASPRETARSVAAASAFMENRMANEIAAINDAVDEILLDENLYARSQAWTRKHAYFMQTAFANTMEPIIWTAGYNGALEKGLSEADAARYADGLVRQTQGSTLPEDVSRIETGPAYARIFTQFIGYFNMMANTNATALKQIAGEMGMKKGAGKALLVVTTGMLIPLWIAEAIAVGMRGGPEDEDDDGYLDDWLAAVFGMGTIKGAFAMVPFVGTAANVALNKMNSNPADDKASVSPAVSLLEAGAGLPKLGYQLATDPEKINARNAVRDVASALTLGTGLPFYALARPLGYLMGVEQGKIEPTSDLDMARGLVTGSASPDSKQ